jgi:hypothetical protein
MIDRHRASIGFAAVAIAAVLICRASAPAGAAAASDDRQSLPPKLDDSISRGLGWLATQQNPDGSFDGGGPRLAVTGLALMSYLACGHTPDEGLGRYGLVVRRAVDYLVGQVPENGYVGNVDNSRMYGQGIVTLALAEAFGVESDPSKRPALHAALTRAVKVILDAQSVAKQEVHAGGWRYTPEAADSDLSLSGWNALALRAAQNVGIDVPAGAVDRAVEFVMKCYNPRQKGFGYQPGGSALPGPTGVGVLSLYLLDAGERKAGDGGGGGGATDRPAAPEGAAFLAAQAGNEAAWNRYPYYTMYYAAQAAFQAGDEAWPAVSKAVFDRLLAQQEPAGNWPVSKAPEEPGRIYSTSMAMLTLSVPYRLLPIYQR